MKYLPTLFLLLALASPLLFARADDSGDERNPDGSRFQFAGQGGELRLRTVNGTTYKMRFNRIVEVDSFGRPVATTRQRLEDNKYSFSTPVASTYPGTSVNVLSTGFTASVKVTTANSIGDGAGQNDLGTSNFTIQVYRFNSDAVVANGNGNSVTVNANDVKFSLVMSSWPFSSPSNRLRLTLKLEVVGSDNDNGHNGEDRVFRKKGDGKNEVSVPFPGAKGRLDLSLVATADGVNQGITLAGYREDGEGLIAAFLPYFNSTLIYDPSLSGQDASTTPAGPSSNPVISAAAGTSASMATIILAIVAIFAALF